MVSGDTSAHALGAHQNEAFLRQFDSLPIPEPAELGPGEAEKRAGLVTKVLEELGITPDRPYYTHHDVVRGVQKAVDATRLYEQQEGER